MNQDLLAALLTTADDRRLTRSERRATRALLEDSGLDGADRIQLMDQLFAATAERMRDSRDREMLGWLEDLVRIVISGGPKSHASPEAWFGPEDPMVESVLAFIAKTRNRLDVAVFTITDDRLSRALIDLHKRGVALRILTDNDKSWDQGSDVRRLSEAGIPLCMDRSEHHFHHKFSVRDGSALLNGSYNWTRGADRNNRENFMVSHNPALVRRYAEAFETMWADLS